MATGASVRRLSPPVDIPLVGVACFVYLVLVEGVESSYLPSPLHPHHLLHTSLTHTLTLLHRFVLNTHTKYRIETGYIKSEVSIRCVRRY